MDLDSSKAKKCNTAGIIRSKLVSEKGASISFALLLFLVCAVFSAIVLVAASSAVGRISGLEETDQRYYAVTSASELVREMMDGKTVTKAGDKCFEMTLAEISEEVYEGDDADNSLPVFTARSVSTVASTKNLTLSSESDALDPALGVTITESVQPDGAAVFVIKGENGSPFKMVLTFSAETKTEALPFYKDINTDESDPGTTGTEYTWHFVGMESSYDG